ncbi:ABC transporter substrate-binding protein [Halovivax gelatinilyticus]|uniref:ABC transporter substrate-binding protein n=1 Tax=Halovivax gelatinilyticus TaxID=2961597 RepID=UPI0020CA3A38|nr:ABC transporter substrate-binding protein [Halovivax gelatinilyticus]
MTRNKFKRREVLGSAAAIGVMSIAGCADDSDSADGSARIAIDDDPTREDWNLYGGVTPYWTNILEPLVWVNEEMELTPWLATDWEQTSETTWEFELREDVQFHNDEEMTADDVVFSFEALLEEHVWAAGWLQIESGSIEALDDHTVEFTNTAPFPVFPGTIAHNMACIQHPDRDHSDDLVIGTGPFQVDEIVPQQEVRTTAFEDYWNDGAQLEELTFEVIEDPNTRAIALTNDEIDVGMSPPRSQVATLEDNDSIVVARQETADAGFAGFNIHRSPTDDATLRRALNHAVDQELLVDTILEGVGNPARGPISPIIFWSAHDEIDPYEHDEELAAELVEESAYDGETLDILLPNDLVDGREIAQVLLDAFDGVGVDAEIVQVERAQFSEMERDGEAHLNLDAGGSNSGDADYIIYEWFHSEGDVNQRLYEDEGTGIHNVGDEVDSLIETGFQTIDPDEKEAAFVEAQQIMHEEAVTIPIYYNEFVAGHAADVEGIDLAPIPQFSRWTSLEY